MSFLPIDYPLAVHQSWAAGLRYPATLMEKRDWGHHLPIDKAGEEEGTHYLQPQQMTFMTCPNAYLQASI
jgi:hypothetical protein